jgi:hypothetical protein
MKYLTTLFFALIAFAFSANAQLTVEGEQVSATITQETSRYELLEIRNAYKEHGVDFRYTNVDWIDGQLTSIKVDLATDDGANTATFLVENFQNGQVVKLLFNKEENANQVLCAGDC